MLEVLLKVYILLSFLVSSMPSAVVGECISYDVMGGEDGVEFSIGCLVKGLSVLSFWHNSNAVLGIAFLMVVMSHSTVIRFARIHSGRILLDVIIHHFYFSSFIFYFF